MNSNSPQTQTPQERYATLVEEFLSQPEVSHEGKGFGASALKIKGKIFAMLVKDNLVVKLPKPRVGALVAAGEGQPFDPRHDGRVMKEWLVLASSSFEVWLALAYEAKAFVASNS